MAGEKWRRYFEFSPLDKNRTNDLCKLCKQSYKDQNGIFSNFLKHLKWGHILEYDQIFTRENECFSEDKNLTGNSDRAVTEPSNTKCKQNQITFSTVKNLIIRCNLPFNLVENPGFREFLKDCNF
jgi:hypothetical protein